MKNYVVSTPTENHFLVELFEAENDFNNGIDAMLKLRESGQIHLIEIPALPNEAVTHTEKNKLFFDFLSNGDAEYLQSYEARL